MRLLVALDQHHYSAATVAEVAGLSINTWPDITLLGVHAVKADKGQLSAENSGNWNQHALFKALLNYRHEFLSYFKAGQSPYPEPSGENELVELKNGLWEEQMTLQNGLKRLKIRIRTGYPFKAVLTEAEESQSDLIVIGCQKGTQCVWEHQKSIPEKIVNHSKASVLVVKENKRPEIIVCCLDHHGATQESIELINQMVTLYQARLEIVGLTDTDTLSTEIERKMQFILDYYTSKDIDIWLRLVDKALIEQFVLQAAKEGLVVLWMGKKSLMERIFQRKSLSTLVRTAQSSMLVLR